MGFAHQTAPNSTPIAMTDAERQLTRIGGFLISEWVQAVIIAIVVPAVIFGFVVSGERDEAADQAVASVEAISAYWLRAAREGKPLQCSSNAAPEGSLDNPFLALAIQPVPFNEDDSSTGMRPALFVEAFRRRHGNDALVTARRFHDAIEARDESLLRGVAKGKNSIRFSVLVSTHERCPAGGAGPGA